MASEDGGSTMDSLRERIEVQDHHRGRKNGSSGPLWVKILIAASLLLTMALPTSASAAANFQATCFGQTGTFKSGTHIVVAYWDYDNYYDECFGISPDRRIYHAWRASPRWLEMPHNGRADNMSSPGYYWIGNSRYVFVVVDGKGRYCSHVSVGRGSWQPWARC
jgi:hypothetical protein